MKRIISGFLVFAMIFTNLFGMTAYAEEGAPEVSLSFSINELQAGEMITIGLEVEALAATQAVTAEFNLPTTIFEDVQIIGLEESKLAQDPNIPEDKYLNATYEEDSGDIYYMSYWTGETSVEAQTLITVTAKIKANAPLGSVLLTFLNEQCAYTEYGNNLYLDPVNTSVNIYTNTVDPVAISITDPVKYETPQATIDAGTGYTGTISWSDDPTKFDVDTTYTATVTLTADTNYKFNDGQTVTVNDGNPTSYVTQNDSIVQFTHTFTPTDTAVVTDVIITGDTTVNVPYIESGTSNTVQLAVTCEENGETILPTPSVDWSITAPGTHKGISIDSDGLLTIDHTAADNTFTNNDLVITVTATSEDKSDTYNVTVSSEDQSFGKAEITRGSSDDLTSDTLIIPQSGEKTYTFDVAIYDQYGLDYSTLGGAWGGTIGDVENVSHSEADVVVASTVLELATGTLTYTPTGQSAVSVDISFSTFDVVSWDNVTVDSSATTYGNTNESFVTISGPGQGSDGQTTAAGTFSIVNFSEYPEVSDTTVTVRFTVTEAGEYQGVTIDKEYPIDITPLPLTITPSAEQTKGYGDLDPILSYTVMPSVAGLAELSGTILIRATGENTGTYAMSLDAGVAAANPNYTLSLAGGTYNFTLVPKVVSVTDATISSKEYDGTTTIDTADVTAVIFDDGALSIDDCTITAASYRDNANVGSDKPTSVSITLTNANYIFDSNQLSKIFIGATADITPKSISGAIVADFGDQIYSGEVSTITFLASAVTLDGEMLVPGQDYAISSVDRSDVGPAVATIMGINNYKDSVTKSFDIVPKSLASASIEAISNQTYTGSAIEKSLRVTMDGYGTLVSGIDYTVAYSDNTNIGTATATITGIGNYTGTNSVEFTIAQKQLAIAPTIETWESDTTNGGLTVTITSTGETGAGLYELKIYDSSSSLVKTVTDITGGVTTNIPLESGVILPDANYTAKARTLAANENYAASELGTETAVVLATVVALSFTDDIGYDIPEAQVGVAISSIDVSAAVSGGMAPFTYSATNLPAGLSINESTGMISGTPTHVSDATTDAVIVTVTDSQATPDTGSFTVSYGAIVKGSPVAFGGNSIPTTATYGDGDITFELTNSGDNASVAYVLINDGGTGATLTGSTLALGTVGTLTIQATGTSDDYENKVQEFTIEVGKKAITITPNTGLEKEFNTLSDPEFTYTVYPSTVGLASLSETILQRAIGENAGNYAISLADGVAAANSNYDISISDGIFNFTIMPKVVSVTGATISSKVYDGTKTIDLNDVTFVTFSDFALSIADCTVTAASYTDDANVGVGKPTSLSIKLTNANYTFASDKMSTTHTSATAEITEKNISTAVIANIADQTYTGLATTSPNPKVTLAKTLLEGVDYTKIFTNNTDVGTAILTIIGKGNYTGTTSKDFEIVQKSLTSATIAAISNQIYTGSGIEPVLTVTLGEHGSLISGIDYTVSYSDNTNIGTAIATITGIGNYKGTATKYFTIEKRSVTDATITVAGEPLIYTGFPLTPEVTVVVNSRTLTQDDYTVSYIDNTDVGTANITITGRGNYEGTVDQTFAINKAIYLGTPITQAVYVLENTAVTGTTFDLDSLPFNSDITNRSYSFLSITSNGLVEDGSPNVSDSTLTYNITEQVANTSDTILITVSSTNYEDITATIIVTATDKTVVNITGVIANDTTYTGAPYVLKENSPTNNEGYDGAYTYTYSNSDDDTPPTNAGTYTLTIGLADTSAHTGELVIPFTINKAELTIKSSNKTITKDSALPTATYQYVGLKGSDVGDDIVLGDKTLRINNTTDTGELENSSSVGAYNIVFENVNDLVTATYDNYTLEVLEGKLTISYPATTTSTTSNTLTETETESEEEIPALTRPLVTAQFGNIEPNNQEPVREVEDIPEDIENVITEPIERKTLEDGTKVDMVKITPETVQEIIENGVDTDAVTLFVDEDSDNPASAYTVNMDKDTLEILSENHLGLNVDSPNGTVRLSPETVEQLNEEGEEVYFEILDVSNQSEDGRSAFAEDNSIQITFGDDADNMQVYGTPIVINTNVEGFATIIDLPLSGFTDEQLSDPEFISTLCVYVEHDEGRTEIIYGEIMYDENGVPLSIEFEIDNFSRFQIIGYAEELIAEDGMASINDTSDEILADSTELESSSNVNWTVIIIIICLFIVLSATTVIIKRKRIDD